MKILQIINSHALQDGGAQRLALELHRAYRERGHDAYLLSLMCSPTAEPGTYSLGFASPYHGAVLPRLIRFLRQKRWRDVDVIHVHLFPAQLLVALAVNFVRLRAPLVTTEHNTFNRRRASKTGRVLDRWTLAAFRAIICISDGTREALAQWQPALADRLETIPNGIDLSRFSGPSEKNHNPTPIIISVGRIAPQKDYATALRAVANLSNRDFRFQIAGQDEMNGEMQRLARELQIEEQVEFLGFQSDIPALLSRADIFLLTSQWEGFGLAVAEAMAAGLPVVVPDVPGVREVVGAPQDRGEETGFLAPAGSSSGFAAHLERLIQDPVLREAVGQKARARAQDFDIERTIEAHLHLYQTLCNSPAPARA